MRSKAKIVSLILIQYFATLFLLSTLSDSFGVPHFLPARTPRCPPPQFSHPLPISYLTWQDFWSSFSIFSHLDHVPLDKARFMIYNFHASYYFFRSLHSICKERNPSNKFYHSINFHPRMESSDIVRVEYFKMH